MAAKRNLMVYSLLCIPSWVYSWPLESTPQKEPYHPNGTSIGDKTGYGDKMPDNSHVKEMLDASDGHKGYISPTRARKLSKGSTERVFPHNILSDEKWDGDKFIEGTNIYKTEFDGVFHTFNRHQIKKREISETTSDLSMVSVTKIPQSHDFDQTTLGNIITKEWSDHENSRTSTNMALATSDDNVNVGEEATLPTSHNYITEPGYVLSSTTDTDFERRQTSDLSSTVDKATDIHVTSVDQLSVSSDYVTPGRSHLTEETSRTNLDSASGISDNGDAEVNLTSYGAKSNKTLTSRKHRISPNCQISIAVNDTVSLAEQAEMDANLTRDINITKAVDSASNSSRFLRQFSNATCDSPESGNEIVNNQGNGTFEREPTTQLSITETARCLDSSNRSSNCAEYPPETPVKQKATPIWEKGIVKRSDFVSILFYLRIFTLVFLIVSILCAILSLAVFSSPRMKCSVAVLIMAFNAIEGIKSFSTFMHRTFKLSLGQTPINWSSPYAGFFSYFVLWFPDAMGRIGILINGLITLEKFVTIAFPIKRLNKKLITYPKTTVAIVILAMLLYQTSTLILFETEVAPYLDHSRNFTSDQIIREIIREAPKAFKKYGTLHMIASCLFRYVPLLLSLVFNVMTMISVRIHDKFKHTEGTAVNSSRMQQRRQMNVMIVGSSLAFTIFLSFKPIVRILSFGLPEFGEGKREQYLYVLLNDLALCIDNIGALIIFVSYFWLSSVFRSVFSRLFFRTCLARDDSTLYSGSDGHSTPSKKISQRH